jgi:hypothetical protein
MSAERPSHPDRPAELWKRVAHANWASRRGTKGFHRSIRDRQAIHDALTRTAAAVFASRREMDSTESRATQWAPSDRGKGFNLRPMETNENWPHPSADDSVLETERTAIALSHHRVQLCKVYGKAIRPLRQTEGSVDQRLWWGDDVVTGSV